jgi:hypothetical protein
VTTLITSYEQSRQKPPGAPQPEVREVQSARVSPLREQDRGNEIARQGEKHANTEEPSGDVSHVEVIEDDCGHREGPKSVEARLIDGTAFRRDGA